MGLILPDDSAAAVDAASAEPRLYPLLGRMSTLIPDIGVAGAGVARDSELMQVLIVDDEPALRQALRRALELDGYEVHLAGDGLAAQRALAEHSPDAVVLDVMMPGADGLEVCRRLRSSGNHVPILLLTVRNRVADVVAGLDAGADDYITKPFAVAELRARLRALVRRSGGTGETLCYGDLSLDAVTREVTRGRRTLELTRTEFALLELFLRHPRQVLSRRLIVERVWGYDLGLQSNSLDVYIGYLRRKLELDGEPRMLCTVRGVGYALRLPRADHERPPSRPELEDSVAG
jgi:two-component system response regulator MprA